MAVKLENVSKVIMAIRWGLLGAAVIAMFVLNVPTIGFVLIAASFLFGMALRFASVRIRVFAALTGMDREVLQMAYAQHKQATAPDATRVTPPAPPVDPNLPRNFYRDPIPMSDESIAAIIDATAEPAVRLVRQWPPSDSFGNSWLGGTPNLPEGIDWPVNDDTGLRLHHLGQIDLYEMPLPDAAPIPRRGMLWFFADISEDLDWPEGPGQATRVLYHPTSTKGRAPVALPDDVPQVDHAGDSMTGTPFSFRAPKTRVYPRWPVTGASTLAWPFSYQPPREVTDPNAFYEAVKTRVDVQKDALTGVKIEREAARPLGRKVTSTEQTRADGSTYTDHRLGDYDPTRHGGLFPYNNRLGWHVLNWGHHAALCAYDRYESSVAFAIKRGDDPDPDAIKKAAAAQELMGQFDHLRARFAQAGPTDPVAADLQAPFDALMQAGTEPYAIAKLSSIVESGLVALVAEAVTAPTLLDALPQDAVARVYATVLPSHHYTEHFLLGPKGSATNPTAGKGIRLAQFDSDYGLGMMFCDCGIIDFWIDADDLAEGRWDRAWGATAGG